MRRKSSTIILYGPQKSGKSSLLSQFALNTFKDEYEATAGYSFVGHESFQFKDLSGHRDRFSVLLSMHINSEIQQGLVIVLSCEATHRPQWSKRLEEFLGAVRLADPSVGCGDLLPIVDLTIFLNKSDLLSDSQPVVTEQEEAALLSVARAQGFTEPSIYIGSAKSGEAKTLNGEAVTLEAVFQELADRIQQHAQFEHPQQGTHETLESTIGPAAPKPPSPRMPVSYKVAGSLAFLTLALSLAVGFALPHTRVKVPLITVCALWKLIAVCGSALTVGALAIPPVAQLLKRRGCFSGRPAPQLTSGRGTSLQVTGL